MSIVTIDRSTMITIELLAVGKLQTIELQRQNNVEFRNRIQERKILRVSQIQNKRTVSRLIDLNIKILIKSLTFMPCKC